VESRAVKSARGRIVSGEPYVAYFSMEIALEPAIPTYSGGLGVLAGDTIRSFADLGVRAAAVTLLHRKGYFRQRLDEKGAQTEEAVDWPVVARLEALAPRVEVEIEGRKVLIRAWRYPVEGEAGAVVPVYLLDTDLPQNAPDDRRLTDTLYGGDNTYRFRQEVVLGIGGVKMLRALGYDDLDRFHLNEGHAALAALELLREYEETPPTDGSRLLACVDYVRDRCVFTTHTPVPAGHDQFPTPLALSLLDVGHGRWLRFLAGPNFLNMTELALRVSHFVNGVAMRHGEVSQDMFPRYPIRSITNGIHPATWASPSFSELFDRFIREWRWDAYSLRYAVGIPAQEIARAHEQAKAALLDRVKLVCDVPLDREILTIGFARRATAYKRATLIFRDLDQLVAIAERCGPLQLVFAGKAHPNDAEGKAIIRQLIEAQKTLRDHVTVAYLPDYDMTLGRLMCAGCDVWLNTPIPPLEASGTSGMKAALNGVPSLSILDGWWVEGCVEGVTGWAIGDDGVEPERSPSARDRAHAEALYEKLATAVLPRFYRERDQYVEMMRYAIALNASFFNTHRMVLQYLYDAYVPVSLAPGRGGRSA
jgi:starch phosphorylase